MHEHQTWKEVMAEEGTWKKAMARFVEKGMSQQEIAKQHIAWKQAHKKSKKPSPEMLGKGKAAGVAKAAVSRKSKLEQLAAELEGKEF
jgi:hypothetical protein